MIIGGVRAHLCCHRDRLQQYPRDVHHPTLIPPTIDHDRHSTLNVDGRVTALDTVNIQVRYPGMLGGP